MVRTPEFKAWFGDWEKLITTKIEDSGIDDVTLARLESGVSKVVDENGEPLVVYHSTNENFYDFKKEKVSANFQYSFGFHFSDNIADSKNYGNVTKLFFLNIKNPLIYNVQNGINGSVFIDENRYDAIHQIVNSKKTNNEIDGVIANSFVSGYVAMYPNQIKLADGTNTTFDPNSDDIRYKQGGITIAQTPAPEKERIYGSDKNKPKSSKDSLSAESIKFDNKTLSSIENKVAEHNESHPDKKVNLATAKAVVRRGMGAYSKSHRPTISGGQPNSRVAWGLARLNAFLYKVVHGVSKSGKYSQDNDLLDELGIAHKKFENGGKIPKKNKGGDCYVVAGRIALNNRLPNGDKPEFIGEPYVVHAQVTGQGAITGLKYGHAWIEDDEYVYDYSNGRNLKVPKEVYYILGQVIMQQPIYFKYTFGEAKKKMAESGHFGDWELKTESGL